MQDRSHKLAANKRGGVATSEADPFDPFMRQKAVAKYIGSSEQTLYRWRRQGKFPPPDGFTPDGAPLWKQKSTVDKAMRQNAEKLAAV